MTNQDRKVIYRMFVFLMRGIFFLVNPDATLTNVLIKDFREFCHALDNPRGWNWFGKDDTHAPAL